MARAKGQGLQRRRGELIERGFAHCYVTGRMRRTHLRHQANILKRVLIHVAAFNLGLAMRQEIGVGTPRGLQGHPATVSVGPRRLLAAWSDLSRLLMSKLRLFLRIHSARPRLLNVDLHRCKAAFATGC